MNDKELLILAAKAVGYTLEEHYYVITDDDQYYPWCVTTDDFWNPLIDNADAFRLMVTLKLHVMFWAASLSVDDRPLEMYENDSYAATRRAIVKAAAEIGKEMK